MGDSLDDGRPSDWLTFAAAREYTGLSRSAFQNARASGRIPTVREKRGQQPGYVLREHCDRYLRAEVERAEAQAVDAERDQRRGRRGNAA